ncbi:hypothetical protein SPRG_04221 [Saprolegnia parasitica CBS 223.65]|uniref:Elicitin n=1 Tax=Saprolegnia parasitica (strain CBS 223.65) TaxID=695850 RepID=A0A067CJW6_SAPPC|nr:hypothetical protein SPRG_04221 [Saprolegnia parasitica CBS 223.65]KDO31034.1 hypothetical protein SPRG_04221 [Saprolegnia parasitica CBS 223.65]|eukprot:XP_012198211.1 hypothetical protein SPRG_04221 [Saprolegnia parasitica CBS 223.65]
MPGLLRTAYLVACTLTVVAGAACEVTELAKPLGPVLQSGNFAKCSSESGVAISIAGPTPNATSLAAIAKTPSCDVLFTDVQTAVTNANLNCTVGNVTVSAFLGTSLSSFLTNLGLYLGTSTTPAPTTKPSTATVVALPTVTIVVATAFVLAF